MKTLKVISEGEKELWDLIREGHEVVINHEEVEEYKKKVHDYHSHQNKLLIEAVLSDVGEGVQTAIRNNETKSDEFAIGYDEALLDLQRYLTKLKEEINGKQ